MKVNGEHYRTIWVKPDDECVIQAIDQRWLPHRFVIEDLQTVKQAAHAISEMHVRGAPLIGVTAAYGMYLAALAAREESDPVFLQALQQAGQLLRSTRPTAVNLAWAVERQMQALPAAGGDAQARIQSTFDVAAAIADEEVENCRLIGEHGVELIENLSQRKGGELVKIGRAHV